MSKEKLSASLIGIALLSAGVLSLEISLTRIFSAVLRYHFVFLVVSIAVCGLGLGAMLYSFLKKEPDFLPGLVANPAGWASILFLVIFFKFVLPVCPEALWFIAIITILPFIFSGVFLASLFTRKSDKANTLYAFDLLGAGVASSLTIVILDQSGAVNSCIISAMIAASAGLVYKKTRILSAVSILLIGVLLFCNIHMNIFKIPRLPTSDTSYAKILFTEIGDDSKVKILLTEWDSFARTDVVRDASMGDDVLLVYTNGNVPTRLIRYDSKTGKYALDANIADVAFELQKPKKVLSIGPGGGMDILLAHKNGAKKIDGVEINPAIDKIMKNEEIIKFAGKPYSIDGVRYFTEDGRTFVEHSKDKYDMIFLSLAKTGTGTFGIALVEGYIYTLEAFDDYLEKLTTDGSIVFVTDGYLLNIRLITTALESVMQKKNIPLSEALKHVSLIAVPEGERVHNPYEYALTITNTAMTPENSEKLLAKCYEKKYIPMLIPGKVIAPDFQPLYKKDATLHYFTSCFYDVWKADFVRRNNIREPDKVPKLNLMPVNDNKPFFLDFSFGIPKMITPIFISSMVLIILLGIGLYSKEISKEKDKERIYHPILTVFFYFTFLGMAFMLVEIPMIQKMILILGHPTYALSVVLVFLLIGAGIGSYVSGLKKAWKIKKLNQAVCFTAALFSFILVFYMNTSHDFILSLPLPGRIAWGGGISLGIGFFLGMPFPVAMRALGTFNKKYIPWMWCVNGISSVLGSILAAIGSKLYGFHMVFMAGALIYLLAALCSSEKWKNRE